MRPFITNRGPAVATGAAIRLPLHRCLAAFATVAVLGVASAQVTITVTGTLQGALDGDTRTWYSLAAQVGGSVLNETSLDEMGFGGDRELPPPGQLVRGAELGQRRQVDGHGNDLLGAR